VTWVRKAVSPVCRVVSFVFSNCLNLTVVDSLTLAPDSGLANFPIYRIAELVKSAGSYQYLQIVHSIREGAKVRQQVFGTLGRLDELKASGRLEALMRSGLRHCENLAVIDAHAAGETEAVRVLRIGPELVSGRLWKESGISRQEM
jgi:hypothetical protein